MLQCLNTHVIEMSEIEAREINIVLYSQQWSPTTNPSQVDLRPRIWDTAVRWGFAEVVDREELEESIRG